MRINHRREGVRCFNEYDCQQTGCPGHTVTLRLHNASDVWEILIDEESLGHFDRNILEAAAQMFITAPEACVNGEDLAKIGALGADYATIPPVGPPKRS